MDENCLDFPTIQHASTSKQIRACYQAIRQLRPHLTNEDEFVQRVQKQITQGYQLVSYCINGEIKAAAGYRHLEFLAWGKVLYIDDLITDSEARKLGYGSKLLKWLIEQAKLAGCDQVHLDSGPHRHDAHRLYLNHEFKITCHHFALELKEPT